MPEIPYESVGQYIFRPVLGVSVGGRGNFFLVRVHLERQTKRSWNPREAVLEGGLGTDAQSHTSHLSLFFRETLARYTQTRRIYRRKTRSWSWQIFPLWKHAISVRFLNLDVVLYYTRDSLDQMILDMCM